MTTPSPSQTSTRRERAAAGTSRRGRALKVGLIGCVLATTVLAPVAAVIASNQSVEQTRTARTAGPKVLAPADGSLRVGGSVIEQMLGECDGASCYHVPPAHPTTVNAKSKGRLELDAGVSQRFSVSMFSPAHPQTQLPYTLTGSTLSLEGMKAGEYVTTVTGEPSGGSWQFTLRVR